MPGILHIQGGTRGLGQNITESIPIYTSFDGQASVDFFIVDEGTTGRSSAYPQTTRSYYRASANELGKKGDIFVTLSISRSNGGHTPEVTAENGRIEQIPDLTTYYKDLAKKSETDIGAFWTILGLSECYSDRDTVDQATRTLGATHNGSQDILMIINAARNGILGATAQRACIQVDIDLSVIQVFVDGTLRGPLSRPIGLAPGSHTVDLRSNGATVGSHTVTVEGGGKRSVSIPVSGASGRAPFALPSITPAGKGSATWFYSAVILVTALWPIWLYAADITELIIIGLVMGLVGYGVIAQKRWSLALLGLIYVVLLFRGGIWSLISLLIVCGIIYFYIKEGKMWGKPSGSPA
ncbi:MAG: hypothetical protein ABFC38_00430 [Methanospirillum sp.]